MVEGPQLGMDLVPITRMELSPEQQLKAQVEELSPVLDIPSDELLSMLQEGSYRVLLVEEDPSLRNKIAGSLESKGCIVKASESVKDAENSIEKSRVWDIAIIRHELKDIGGLDLRKKIYTYDSDLPVLVYGQNYNELVDASSIYKFVAVPFPVKTQEGPGSIWDLDISQLLRNVVGGSLFSKEKTDLGLDKLIDKLQQQFFRVNLKTKIPILIKDGGSLFDDVDEDIDQNALIDFCADTIKFAKKYHEYATILCPGGGKLNDYIKDHIDKREMRQITGDRSAGDPIIERMAQDVLLTQARKIFLEYCDQGFGDKVHIINPNDPMSLGEINDGMFDEKPIMIWPYAPRELRRAYHLSMAYSDVQTFATGALFRVLRALFVKSTQGIYTHDPKDPEFDAEKERKILEAKCRDLREGYVIVDGQRYDVSRIGTDKRDNHLCENAGLQFMEDVKMPLSVCVAKSRTS